MPNPHHRARRPARLSLTTAALCSVFTFTGAVAADVRVFTDQSIPVTAPGDAKVIHLDTGSRIEAQLTVDLPADAARAEAIVRQRLQQGGDKLQRDLAQAYQDVVDAWGMGISTLPAVVVDQRHVVYGEPDVGKAVARIETYKKEQP